MVLQKKSCRYSIAEIVLQKGCKKTCKTSVLKFENMWLEFFVELKNVNNWVRYQSVRQHMAQSLGISWTRFSQRQWSSNMCHEHNQQMYDFYKKKKDLGLILISFQRCTLQRISFNFFLFLYITNSWM